MAISAINITQDNKVGASSILAIHSPVTYLVEATYTSKRPEFINVEIYSASGSPVLLDTYRSIYIRDISTTVIEFAFIANDPIKSLMSGFDDIFQLNNTLINIPGIIDSFTLKFVDPENALIFDSANISPLHGTSQFGESPNKDYIYNNESQTYYMQSGGSVYVYYNNQTGTNLEVLVNGISISTTSATKSGYYRWKMTSTEDAYVEFSPEFAPISDKFYIKVIDECEALILKYLDSNGQYRFYPLNKFWKKTGTPKKIGSTNKFLTNILTDQSDTSNIGYRNQNKIQAAVDVDNEKLPFFSYLYDSPRVYMYIGTTTDTAADWLEVDVIIPEPIYRRRKANSSKIDVTISLPKHYTTKMI